MTTRIAIMGAGPGGLAAAMLMASDGFDVDVYESENVVGGRTSQIHKQGFRFDTGPTFFLYPEVLKQIFSRCGFCFEDEVELIRLDPLYEIIYENSDRIKVFKDLPRLRDEISRISIHDAANIELFMRDNEQKFAHFLPVLQRPFLRWSQLFSIDLLKSLSSLRPFSSVNKDLSQFFQNENIRLAFSFQSKYLGMSPFNCPSLFTILAYMEHEYGVYHPVGGCNAIIRTMARLARRMGVRIHLNDAVKNINFAGRRFKSLNTQSGRKTADALIVNADFAHFVSRFVPQKLLSSWNHTKLKKKQFSCSTFMMYLGIKGNYPQLEHHSILLSEAYKANLFEIEAGVKPPESPSLYVQNACSTDPKLAPAGYSTLYVLVPVANQINAVDWTKHRLRYRNLVIKRLGLLGIEDLERRIVFEKIVTPQDWLEQHSIYQGATFNLAHSMNQMLHRRPQNRFSELKGVYLVGGGTHPGSGLPVIFEGARITADLVRSDYASDRVKSSGLAKTVSEEAVN